MLSIFVSGFVCQHGHRIIPLRFDTAIDYLRQYEQFRSSPHKNHVPYEITLNDMLIYSQNISFSNSNISVCEQNFIELIQAASLYDTWALKILDSWGKPLPSGLFKGNIYWTGNYDECLQQMYLPIMHPDEACLPISWYLYNDMQFHWIAPFILIPFVIERKFVASIIAAIFVFISISSILGTLIYYPTISFGPLQGIATENDGPSFFKSVYVAPWCRISAYAIDLMVGFLVIKASRTYRFKLSTKIIGNLVMCLIALTCIFSMYADAILVPGLNRSWLVAYQTLSHTCWSLVIGWLIFLCSTNQGGIINTILSWSIWHHWLD
ncbi:unnamed protein product [Rotaria sp. Silwood2]|nr:unnamed protein product [Rotaria sp. Silwood2]